MRGALPRLLRRLLAVFAGLGAWASSSCAPTGFQNGTVVSSVRILASSADQPYAQPGSTVTVTVLAHDGRTTQPEKMTEGPVTVPSRSLSPCRRTPSPRSVTTGVRIGPRFWCR